MRPVSTHALHGLPPTRATAPTGRWHPYKQSQSGALPTPSSLPCTPIGTVPKEGHLKTPISGLVKSITTPHPTNAATTSTKLQKEPEDLKRAQKEKFETALKELAVQRLTDVWHETSYVIRSAAPAAPSAFASFEASSHVARAHRPTQQLPSPSTPTTQSFASPQPVLAYLPSHTPSSPCRIPLRAFVYEILRRSKTTWPALQIALCYLDALKGKVAQVMAEVKNREGLQAAEAALDQLFGSASANDLSVARRSDAPTTKRTPTAATSTSSEPSQVLSQTVPKAPSVPPVDAAAEHDSRTRRRKLPSAPVEPLPPRPSPLLCPRRMFVASLILATKFTQDRVYSNRAWAKICGLDAREIGRCERALGEALEWRLWVGKGMDDEPTQFLRNWLRAEHQEEEKLVNKARGVARSKSEGDVLFGSSPKHVEPAPALAWQGGAQAPNNALKKSVSLGQSDFAASAGSSAMLNDPATMVLTPPNADLDALDRTPLLDTSSSATTSAYTSFSSVFTPPTVHGAVHVNEFSFTPSLAGLPTPPAASSYAAVPLRKPPPFEVSGPPSLGAYDAFALGLGPQEGLEGTFDMSIHDIVEAF